MTRTRESYAAVYDNPVTLNVSAISGSAVGEISEDDFADVCARFVEVLKLDLTTYIAARVGASIGGEEPPPEPA